jgi:hypothetical protein
MPCENRHGPWAAAPGGVPEDDLLGGLDDVAGHRQPVEVRDHHRAAVDQQPSNLSSGGRPVEPVPTLTGADHVEGVAGEPRLLGAHLAVVDLHAGVAVEPPCLLEQRGRDIDGSDVASVLREKPRQAACAGAEIGDARARSRDAARGEPVNQFGREPRPVRGVVGCGPGEIRSAARDPGDGHPLAHPLALI